MNPPVKWIIENQIFDEDLRPMIEEIRSQGMEVEEIRYLPFESGNYDIFPDDTCVVFYGSLNLCRQLQREKPWIPGSWCTLKNFKCSTYYAHFGQYLLNQDYIMLPQAELLRRKDKVFGDRRGVWSLEQSTIFARPDTGFKSFSGGLFVYKNFEKDYEWWDEFGSPESLVIVADLKTIVDEFRFVVADKKIIAGSKYKYCGKLCMERWDDKEHPQEAIELAREIAASDWQPDPMYVIDIASYRDKFHLLEINSFSCSGLYHCDVKPIIEAAKEIAQREWTEYQGNVQEQTA